MEAHLVAVQRALDFIESRRQEPFTLEAVARRAGFSLWHFQRMFAALTGEPLGSYVRRRRLTAAAVALRTSRQRLLEVALDHQFESHEAFTRAFKSLFGVTPSAFRRDRGLPWVQARPPLSAAGLRHLSSDLTMKPKIIELPAFTLLGLEARFIGALSPDANNLEIIPPLFGKFFALRPKLPPARDGFTYGACTCLPAALRRHEDELVYLVGIHVAAGTKPGRGLKTWKVPARTYAHFTHRGPIARLSETINHAYGAWLPRSKYQRAAGPELERYDDRFCGGEAKSEMDYLIPIRLRK